jgi:hypothetical protein
VLTKRAVVYLDTGTTKEHHMECEDDASYVKWVNTCADALTGDPRGILVFTTPFCIYKVQNIVAVEFLDPPPPNEKLPIGYKLPPKPNPNPFNGSKDPGTVIN